MLFATLLRSILGCRVEVRYAAADLQGTLIQFNTESFWVRRSAYGKTVATERNFEFTNIAWMHVEEIGNDITIIIQMK